MRRFTLIPTLSAALCAAWGAAAAAECPDPFALAAQSSATGPDLIVPQRWDVRAGGDLAIPCEGWREAGVILNGAEGFLPAAPTRLFDLSGLGPHILVVRAYAVCDPVLAVQGGDGLWYLGEENGSAREVTLWGASDGILKVWVGSGDTNGCDAQIELETYDR